MVTYSEIEENFVDYYVRPFSELTRNKSKYSLDEIRNMVLSVPENNFLDEITQYIKNIEIGQKKRINDLWSDLIHPFHQKVNFSGFHYIAQHPESNEIWVGIGEKYGFNSMDYVINDESYLKAVFNDLDELYKQQSKSTDVRKLLFLTKINPDPKIELFKKIDVLFWNLKTHILEIESKIIYEQNKKIEPTKILPKDKDKEFSVLEWATIFYYADETHLTDGGTKTEKLEKFKKDHSVKTTLVNLRQSYYEAKQRINDFNNYPIGKLSKIKPFLESFYSKSVVKLENDIEILKNYLKDKDFDY